MMFIPMGLPSKILLRMEEEAERNRRMALRDKAYENTRPPAGSGEGRKDDTGKVRFELLPPEPLFGIAKVLTFGAAKYSDRNWERGMAWGRVFGALMRHMWAWWGGKGPTTKSFLLGDMDDETKMSHLWHAGCCLFFLIAYEERGIGTDDRCKTTGETDDRGTFRGVGGAAKATD